MKRRDREVEAICAPSEYYRVRSHLRRRRRYFMHNALDDIGETTKYKRKRNNSPSVQGPCRTLEYDRQCPTITIAESSLSLKTYN